MYIFGIDIQLNILVLLNIIACLVEFLLIWKISKKMKGRAEHRAVQRRMEEDEVEE